MFIQIYQLSCTVVHCVVASFNVYFCSVFPIMFKDQWSMKINTCGL